MVFWDFRVIRRKLHGRDFYQVHRVFYSDASKTKPVLVENVPATLVGIAHLPMIQDVEMMAGAFENPTIYIPEWNSNETA